jgi:L-glyceraldehyde 3-phosphate reductase
MIGGCAAQRREAIACALDHGINYFDTAPGYGAAVSETNLGAALHELRARPLVATKVTLAVGHLEDIAGAVERSVEDSLKRLRVSELEVIQLHNRVGVRRAPKAEFGTGMLLAVDDVLGPGGVVEAFERLRARGLVRFFGCTAFGGDMGIVERVIDSDAFDVLTVHYSMLNDTAWTRQAKVGTRNYAGAGARAASRRMGTVALRVLEGGALTSAGVGDEASRAAARQVESALSQMGVGLTEAGIRFALSNDELSTVLIGFSDIGQVRQALACSIRGPLPEDILGCIERCFRMRGGD